MVDSLCQYVYDTDIIKFHGNDHSLLTRLVENRQYLKNFIDEPKNKKKLTSLLLFCSYWGNEDMLGLLFENGAKVNSANEDGYTPLHAAAFMDDSKLISLLFENGAEHIANNEGITPLMAAAMFCNESSFNMLKIYFYPENCGDYACACELFAASIIHKSVGTDPGIEWFEVAYKERHKKGIVKCDSNLDFIPFDKEACSLEDIERI
jgi:hypothetical protein